jgi:16S rRNA (adenine1518-N6/adenine1519-N6)-dimethyltransferase
LVAGPGEAAFGSLSLLVASMAETRVLGRIGPGAFDPPPRVDSAFVGLVPRGRPELASDARYRRFKVLVRAAFAHRRKTLRNSLAGAIGRESASELVDAAGLDELVRGEELGLEDFLALLSVWDWPRGLPGPARGLGSAPGSHRMSPRGPLR